MIEYECCGSFYNADEISFCAECGIELCSGCFQDHVKECISNDEPL